MKSFISLLLSLTCLFLFSACDSHSWEDTYDADGTLVPGSKRLFQAHGSHDDHSKHGDSHDSHDDHAAHGGSTDKGHDTHKAEDHHATEGH